MTTTFRTATTINDYNSDNTLSPAFGVLSEDITKYTNEELQHEWHLSYEVLNDIHYEGKVVIKGMLKEDLDQCCFGKEQFMFALSTWQQRFARAENELERRFLLS